MAGGDVACFLNRHGTTSAQRYELGHGATVHGDGDPLSRFNPAKHLADRVPQFADGD
jgi:hypothetical protein